MKNLKRVIKLTTIQSKKLQMAMVRQAVLLTD